MPYPQDNPNFSWIPKLERFFLNEVEKKQIKQYQNLTDYIETSKNFKQALKKKGINCLAVIPFTEWKALAEKKGLKEIRYFNKHEDFLGDISKENHCCYIKPKNSEKIPSQKNGNDPYLECVLSNGNNLIAIVYVEKCEEFGHELTNEFREISLSLAQN